MFLHYGSSRRKTIYGRLSYVIANFCEFRVPVTGVSLTNHPLTHDDHCTKRRRIIVLKCFLRVNYSSNKLNVDISVA